MNNRQGGRRRGRGGQSPRGMSGNAGGNARDNRQRGNAAQLLEKYKALARDAQLAGDRVQTEYYLQFADHYFRVLSETRSRFEDQRPRRDDEDDGEEMDDEAIDAEGEDEPRQDRRRERDRPERDRSDRGDRYDRPERAERSERPERAERSERSDRGEAEGGERRERVARDRDRDDRGERRPRRDRFNGRDRDEGEAAEDTSPRIAHDILPPAIGIAPEQPEPGSVVDEDEAPKPRRRTRRVRPVEDEGEIAPAA